MARIDQIIDGFHNGNVLIIGDLMLDRYIQGDVKRISPEAPVPIINQTNYSSVPGGAANSARNVASLGGIATIIGSVGMENGKADTSGEEIIRLLNDQGVNTGGIFPIGNYFTTTKTRFISDSQQLLRWDKEMRLEGCVEKAYEIIEKIVPNVDIIIVSDYNKGLITKELAGHIKKTALRYDKRIVADIKPENMEFFKDVYLIKPNKAEAAKMSGINITNYEGAVDAGRKLQGFYNSNILLTLGKDGMILFDDDKHYIIKASAAEIVDVSGAGDTVIATLGLCLATGASLKESAQIANHAASIVVRKKGTAVTNPEELKKAIRQYNYRNH